MRLTRVHPGLPQELDLDAPDSRDQLLDWYRPPSADWVRLNLVLSLSGSAVGPDGTSNTLTSRTDRRILGVIRELSDAIVVGAQTVRAEGYQIPRLTRLAIITSSGDFAGHRLDADQSNRVTVLCPPSAADVVRSQLPAAEILTVDAPSGRIDATAIVETLRAAGHRSLVCEGGPSLASSIVAAGLLDDACLTISPTLRDSAPSAFASTGLGEHALTLEQLLLDDESYLFTRWSSRARPANA